MHGGLGFLFRCERTISATCIQRLSSDLYSSMARWHHYRAIPFFCFLGVANFCLNSRASHHSPIHSGGAGIPGSEWRQSAWFGFYNTEFCPWLYQREHGWMFLAEGAASPEGDSIWDVDGRLRVDLDEFRQLSLSVPLR